MSGFKPKFAKPTETLSFLDRNIVDNTTSSSLIETTDFIYNKYHSQSIQQQRQNLPIFNNRNHILYLLEKYQTLILIGETGCGKSTQIPQYMLEAEWPLQIGICEPRRIAAITLANRVADELGTIVQNDKVGYAVRFDTCDGNRRPKIKYMTEGILIREIMGDPLLRSYSCIMLDEVHERTLYTDILMGLMKKILKKRREFRLIVASATMDAKHLYEFFNYNDTEDKRNDTTVLLSVKGRQFPVTTHYTTEPVPCYVEKSVEVALKINNTNENGDILIFLTGQEEVERVCNRLREHAQLLEQNNRKNKFIVLPMYSSLSYHDQLKVFKPPPLDGYRKIVVATNVAETCVTIPGVVFVIDCGFVKMKWFNKDTHIDNLITLPISQASANQRAGRAGRLRPGKVYRLYTEQDFSKLPKNTPPEIVRCKLTYAILQLKAFGIENILKFKLPNPPPIENVKSALELLYALNAIDINGELIKPLGYQMAEFALDPFYTRILLNSGEFGCSEEILTILAMLQIETIWTKPNSGQLIIKQRIQKRLFEVEEGDLITYLNVFNAFIESDLSPGFCHKNFINYKCMKRVIEIRDGLRKMLNNYNIPLISSQRSTETIQKCLVSGLFPNAAYLHYSGVYKTIRGDIALYIHPDSVLYTIKQPQWVIFCDVVHQSNKLYMRDLTVIKSEWLLELAPHFYYKTTSVLD